MSTRRANMLNEIVACLERAGAAGMTRKELAACLGLKTTPYLRELVNQVVASGWATVVWDDAGRRAQWRYFYASPVAEKV